MSELAIFESDKGDIQVQLSGDTVWLRREQITLLFGRDRTVIGRHITNVFKEGELDKNSVCAKYAHTAEDGKEYQVEHYNLDVIISVGYRVKSQHGVRFRQWATALIKQHLVDGYTLNQKRLEERGIEISGAISLLSRTLESQKMLTPEGQVVFDVISQYSRSWSLLQGYDEQSLDSTIDIQRGMTALIFDSVKSAVQSLKVELIKKGEATELFANIKDNGFESAIATIEQGFGDELFYPNVASRASNLLYLIIKNHSLTDGNKRTGSFVFLWYLRLNQHLLAKPVDELINDNTLVALALLVAESLPEHKDLMIKLVEHFITLKTENVQYET